MVPQSCEVVEHVDLSPHRVEAMRQIKATISNCSRYWSEPQSNFSVGRYMPGGGVFSSVPRAGNEDEFVSIYRKIRH